MLIVLLLGRSSCHLLAISSNLPVYSLGAMLAVLLFDKCRLYSLEVDPKLLNPNIVALLATVELVEHHRRIVAYHGNRLEVR